MLILKKSCKALITALCTLFIYSCSSNNELDINSYQLQSIHNGNLVQMMPRKSIQLSCLLKQPATIQKNLCLSLFHLKKT